ncbi:Phosphatidylinositol-glycan biosynthesis class W, partial [Paramuricea clavata]
MAAENTSYRNLQKSFISNLNGTTAFEISLATSSAPVSVLLRSLLCQFLAGNRQTLEGIFPTSIIFMLEYVTLVLPTFLVFTVLADYAFIFNLLLLLLATTGLFFQGNSIQNQTFSVPVLDKKKRFLCNFRAYVNIATAISILAVDFSIYPRRYAKTETYGTGLMDVGVGSFMIANAVVCQDARGATASTASFAKAVKKELRAVFVLLGLGLVRFAAVKTTDYQEHVSEYGVHWNFFLTLACVRVLSIIILRTLPENLGKHPWIIGILIGLFYQRALVNGLENFVLNGSRGDGSRSNFIDANREGICSSLGYVALYFIGVSIGKLFFYN